MGGGVSAQRPANYSFLSRTTAPGERSMDPWHLGHDANMNGRRDRWPATFELDMECSKLCKVMYQETSRALNLFEEHGYDVLCVNLAECSGINSSPYAVIRSKDKRFSHRAFVVFRGSQDTADLITNFCFKPRELDEEEPAFGVHSGLHETAKASLKVIFPALLEAQLQSKIDSLTLTGHSMGGGCAMALLLLLQQRRLLEGWSCDVSAVTFGAPLVFAGAACLTNSTVLAVHHATRCYVHRNDLIPRLLGRKRQSWASYFERNGVFAQSGAAARQMAAAGAVAVGAGFVAVTCATGGLAAAVAAGATAAVIMTGRGEVERHGTLKEAARLAAVTAALTNLGAHRVLDAAEAQGYEHVGRFWIIAPGRSPGRPSPRAGRPAAPAAAAGGAAGGGVARPGPQGDLSGGVVGGGLQAARMAWARFVPPAAGPGANPGPGPATAAGAAAAAVSSAAGDSDSARGPAVAGSATAPRRRGCAAGAVGADTNVTSYGIEADSESAAAAAAAAAAERMVARVVAGDLAARELQLPDCGLAESLRDHNMTAYVVALARLALAAAPEYRC